MLRLSRVLAVVFLRWLHCCDRGWKWRRIVGSCLLLLRLLLLLLWVRLVLDWWRLVGAVCALIARTIPRVSSLRRHATVLMWWWRKTSVRHVWWWTIESSHLWAVRRRILHAVSWMRGISVRTVMRMRRRRVHWARRPCSRVTWVVWWATVLLRIVAWGVHRSPGDSWDRALLIDGRLGVHALLRADVTKLRVIGWLNELSRLL